MFVINRIYKSPDTKPKRQAIWTSGVSDIKILEETLYELFSAFCSMPFSRIGLLQLDFIKWNERTTDNY